MHYKLLLAFILLPSLFASVLVLEYQPEDQTNWHGVEVAAVACPEEQCDEFYTGTFSGEEFLKDVAPYVANNDIVNMSFAIFEPEYPTYEPMKEDFDFNERLNDYRDALNQFKADKVSLFGLIESNPDKLFAVAAGNGVRIGMLNSLGIAVSKRNALYPSLFSLSNTIKVAALKSKKVSMENLKTQELANYSNFGLEHVDVAAPVPLNTKGEEQRGTSFATPNVARLASELLKKDSSLQATKLKEILMKSCYVQNPQRAAAVSIDIKVNGKNSDAYWAQHKPIRRERLELMKKYSDVMFVKCGGFVVDEVAHACLDNHLSLSLSITNACLKAQSDVLGSDPHSLRYLWEVRGYL